MAPQKLPPARVVRVVELVRHQIGWLHRHMAPASAVMLETITSAWVAQAITAAADIGIADALADGPLSVDELASAVDADADTLRRLLRALIGRGIFRQLRDGRYDLTPLADTLRTDANVSLAALARFQGSPQHREHWSHLTGAIRTGRAVVPELRGKPVFEYLADEPELSEIFNNAMTNVSDLTTAAVIAGYDFSPYPTIVDVGGGHGRILAAILGATPRSRGILFDLPQVVSGAGPVLAEHGVAERVRVEGGSFFESVPEAGDAYVLQCVIHDWPDDEAIHILRNVRAAAGPGKRVMLVEFVLPQHDRDFAGKWTDLEMLVQAGARERTAAEYEALLSRAGFRVTGVFETASPISIVEAIAI